MATVTKGRTFTSGETVTPTKLNDARTVSNIVNADISSGAAIALSKLATGALPTAITVASANIVDGTIVNAKGETVSTAVGTVNVTLDSSSVWTLTGDVYITSFSGDASCVVSNGYTLYVNGTALTGTN